MKTDPILASRKFPPGHDGYRVPLVMRVEGGLHYIKGNGSPYFSLTYTQHRAGFPEQCYSGGADHDYILKYFPRFADLAALHLADINGAPMYAEANGWYRLAGALGGMGEKYHIGNSKRNFPRAVIDPARSWETTEYREPTREECVAIFAEFCRFTVAEARELMARVMASPDPRATWALEVEAMRPRWKREAKTCIAHHNLRVFGDPWEQAA